MFFSSTSPDAAPVPDGSRYVLAAVIIPLVLICLFGGCQFLPGGPESWTNYLKLDPSDDDCALINYAIVGIAAIVGMGAGMKLGGEHFPGRLIAGSIMSFCLAMMANGVYTKFKGATVKFVKKTVGVKEARGESDEDDDEDDKHKNYSPDEEEDDDEQSPNGPPDALEEIAAAMPDADGPAPERQPYMDVPVEHGSYESLIEPGDRAIGHGLGDSCITGCSIVNLE